MEYSDEDNRIAALDEARNADLDTQKPDASQAKRSPREPIISFSADLPYIFAILIAIAKDFSDYILTMLLSIPVIGPPITMFLGILIALIAMCLLSLVIFLAEPSSFFRNFGFLFGGTAIDLIPFLNLLPAMTAATIFIYGKKIAERILRNKGAAAKMITKYALK